MEREEVEMMHHIMPNYHRVSYHRHQIWFPLDIYRKHVLNKVCVVMGR